MPRLTTRTALTTLGLSLLLSAVSLGAPSAVAAATDAMNIVNAPYGAAGRTSQVKIDGLLGGVVTAGRMTVVIPPGAIAGTAVVTVTQPDTAQLVTELHVSPESLNQFQKYVRALIHASR